MQQKFYESKTYQVIAVRQYIKYIYSNFAVKTNSPVALPEVGPYGVTTGNGSRFFTIQGQK